MKQLEQIARILIYIGFFLLPFDNIKFAPSAGWATISPYFFLLAASIIFLSKPGIIITATPNSSTLRFTTLILITSSSIFSYLLVDAYWKLIILTSFKLCLGISAYICLLYILTNWEKSESNYSFVKNTISFLSYGYLISIIFGLFQYLAILGIGPRLPLEIVFSRYYPDKVQFTFTEPSFASLHAIGVILPIALIFYKSHRIQSRNLLLIGSTILILSIISGSSLRALVDSALILIALTTLAPYKKKLKLISYSIVSIALISLVAPSNLTNRFDNIFIEKDRQDPSSTIRLFRSQAAVLGTINSPFTLIFGYGFGNSGKAMDAGYSQAMESNPNSLTEIQQLEQNQDGLTYSLHAKIFSEHGVIGYILLLLMLASRSHKLLFVITIIVYLQFDSYAFYTIWIYLACKKLNLGSDMAIRNTNQSNQKKKL